MPKFVADSSVSPTGLKWAAPAGGGKVLQVVQDTHSTAVSTTSTTFVDTDLDATITPTLASSKILVLVFQNSIARTGGAANGLTFRIVRGATEVIQCGKVLYTESSIGAMHNPGFFAYLDSPATTSATTYKTQFLIESAGITGFAQQDGRTGVIVLMEIGA